MHAVIDTNVLISALIRPQGVVGLVLRHLRDGDFTILYSEAMLSELVGVLGRPRIKQKYGLTDDDIKDVLKLIWLRGQAVEPAQTIQVCRDPKDGKFLETAVAASADCIVTGDADLLVLHPFQSIPILPPGDFLQQLNPS